MSGRTKPASRYPSGSNRPRRRPLTGSLSSAAVLEVLPPTPGSQRAVRSRRWAFMLPVALAVVAFAAAPAQAAAPQLWAAGLGRDNVPLLGDRLAQKARAAGLNTLLVDQARLSRHQAQRVHALVTRFGFRKILSPHAPARSVKRGAKVCSAVKRKHPKWHCTVVARTFAGARRLAIKPQVDLVVVRRNQLPPLAQLKALHGSRGRVVVLVRIGRARSLQTAAWRAAIAQAAASDFFDLAVAPVRAHGSRLLEQYLGLLGQASAPPPPPPPPP